jgi:hypothetical protein
MKVNTHCFDMGVFVSRFMVIMLSLVSFQVMGQNTEQRAIIANQTQVHTLKELSTEFELEYKNNLLKTKFIVNTSQKKFERVQTSAISGFGSDGTPLFYGNLSLEMNEKSRTNSFHNGEIATDIQGQNMVIGVWDSGSALLTHQELSGRVIPLDQPDGLGKHSTLILGNLISSGIKSKAQGMAPKAQALMADWGRDKIEVTHEAANGMLVSNHSYGILPDRVPDWYFGAYIKVARDWDNIMYFAPYYLMVVAAGNAQQTQDNAMPVFVDTTQSYDLMLGFATCKNNLTVASAEMEIDAHGKLTNASVAAYSSFGPLDDGRIKPDISAMGSKVYTTANSGNKEYTTATGTSMAATAVSGTATLLQQYHEHLYGGFLKSATVKGVLLHGADDVNEPGPDYKMGWGMLNASNSGNIIKNKNYSSLVEETQIQNDEELTYTVTSNGKEPLMVSISWTDPEGNFINSGNINDATPSLSNDLDLVVSQGNQEYLPYVLNPKKANLPATQENNSVDVFEKIDIPQAQGEYTISVRHKGSLQTGAQPLTLIVTGVKFNECQAVVPTDFNVNTLNDTSILLNWYGNDDTHYEVRYRKMGTTSWEQQNIIGTQLIWESIDKTLMYEFQIKAMCTENIVSEFSAVHQLVFEDGQAFVNLDYLGTLSHPEQVKVSLFPNPAVHTLAVDGIHSPQARFKIVSTTGVTMKQGVVESQGIFVEDLPKGMYVLSIFDDGEVYGEKFLKD